MSHYLRGVPRELLGSAGTAAPVIALASVVSLSEMAGQEFRLIDTRYSHPEWWAGRNNYKRLQWWWWLPSAHRKWSATSRGLSRQVKLIDVETDKHLGLLLSFQLAQAANAYMQAALLAGALLSLAYHTNAVPPWIAIVVAVAGVLILGVSGWIAIRAKALNLFHPGYAPRTCNT